jgi:hypothetical protein
MTPANSAPEATRQHYLVTLNRAHIRIYREDHPPGQSHPSVRPVEAFDFPNGLADYTDRNTDRAGRFQGPRGSGGIDERLPSREEEEKRVTDELSRRLNEFFRAHPRDSWDLAAPAAVYRALLGRLEPAARSRMRRALQKDLVKHPAGDLPAHFAAA